MLQISSIFFSHHVFCFFGVKSEGFQQQAFPQLAIRSNLRLPGKTFDVQRCRRRCEGGLWCAHAAYQNRNQRFVLLSLYHSADKINSCFIFTFESHPQETLIRSPLLAGRTCWTLARGAFCARLYRRGH